MHRLARKNRFCQLILLCLLMAAALAAMATTRGAESSPDRQRFLESFARSYFPGRSGQLMIVPAEGTIITNDDPAYRYMHGSPWDYDSKIPLLFYGPAYFASAKLKTRARHQDILPTLAAILKLHLPRTVTGRVLAEAFLEASAPPRAIFLAVLDAMRADYLERHRSRLPTLSRLFTQGASFENLEIDYLPTATAVAHSTVSTGTDPGIHGIVANSLFYRQAGRVVNPFPDKSPWNLMALTLADLWNVDSGGEAVIAVQGSTYYAAAALGGRGGCLLNGRRTILASYDSRNGGWETNPDCFWIPDYLRKHNSRDVWTAAGGKWLDHEIASPGLIRRSAVFLRFEAEALMAILENEPIGQDATTDLLLANVKTLDYVGHQYGPDSREIEESLVELDRQMGRILEVLDQRVGRDHYVVVLTADHGMPPEPGPGQRRVFAKDIVDLVHQRFDPERKLVLHYEGSNSQMVLDPGRLRRLGLDLRQIRDYLETQPVLFAVFTEEEVRRVDLP